LKSKETYKRDVLKSKETRTRDRWRSEETHKREADDLKKCFAYLRFDYVYVYRHLYKRVKKKDNIFRKKPTEETRR